ncbi:MAG: tetratricopeptide repeat protein [Aureispira sp.]
MQIEKSIVVLPFKNISANANQYFADGVTEELINALSGIPELKVTARTSAFAYKDKSEDIRKIGKDLKVTTALEGSIRLAGNRVRVSAQLVRTQDGFQIWSDRYDLNLKDIFDVQDKICLMIADQIREHFGHFIIEDHLIASTTENMDVYSTFLEARYYHLKWNFDFFDKAITLYKYCIELDPNFYKAHFGLVNCYGFLATWGIMDREEALNKANFYFAEGFQLNNNNFEAYLTIANKALWVEWKPNKALNQLSQALFLKPNNPEVLESSAECYLALGDFENAMKCIDRAIDVNPLSANHFFIKGNIYYHKKRFKKALEFFSIFLLMDPDREMVYQVTALIHVLTGDKEALDGLIESNKQLKEAHFFKPLYEVIQNQNPMPIRELEESSDIYLPWKFWSLLYVGDKERALEQLHIGIENKLSQYINFIHDPLNKPLKSDKRFLKLVEQVFDKPQEMTLEIEKNKKQLMSLQDQMRYTTKLNQLMIENKIYTEPSLSLRNLSAKMDLNTNKLSWLINEVIGKNFNEYVNSLRIEEFKKNALEPKYSAYSLLGLALNCGFNSKSVFNDFFKRSEGITPSAWLKAQNNTSN